MDCLIVAGNVAMGSAASYESASISVNVSELGVVLAQWLTYLPIIPVATHFKPHQGWVLQK